MNIENLLTNFNDGVTTTAQAFPILVRIAGDTSGTVREKASADGRPTYKVDGQVMTVNREGKTAPAQNVYLHSIEPLAVEIDLFAAAPLYRAEGKVWVKPFVSNDRIAYSICAERLVKVNAAPTGEGK